MPKSPEQNLERYTKAEAADEASKMKEKIKNKEAKNYTEAEKLIAKEVILKTIKFIPILAKLKSAGWDAANPSWGGDSYKKISLTTEELNTLEVFKNELICSTNERVKDALDYLRWESLNEDEKKSWITTEGTSRAFREKSYWTNYFKNIETEISEIENTNNNESQGKLKELRMLLKQKRDYDQELNLPDSELIQIYITKLGKKMEREKEHIKKYNLNKARIIASEIQYYGVSGITICERKFDFAVNTLKLDELMKLIEQNKIEVGNEMRSIFSAAILKQLTPDNLERVLKHPISDFISPDGLIEKMKAENAESKYIKLILNKYSEKINFSKLSIFGDKSIFANFKDRGAQETAAVGFVADNMIKKLESRLTEIRERIAKNKFSSYTPGFGIDSLKEPVLLLKAAAEAKIAAKEYQTLLNRITNLIPYLETYSSGVIHGLSTNISATEVLCDNLTNIKPEGFTGKGIELLKDTSDTGARRVYFEGKYLFSIPPDAALSERAIDPTNELFTYVLNEVIDQDHVKGTQNRDTVYAWKKGWDGPKAILEDHAWSAERYFRFSPPEITPEGKISVSITNGKKTEVKEIVI